MYSDTGGKNLDQMSPKEWLAYLRQKHGYAGKFAIPKSSIEEFIEKIPLSGREKAREVWMSRYTMTVGDIHDELMQHYLQELLPILRSDEKAVADTTFFGILSTSDFSGYTGFTPRGDRTVILHEGLGYTLSYWAHWYLKSTIDKGGKDYLGEDAKKLMDALRYILLIWYGRNPNMALPDIYPETDDSWDLSECLAIAAIAFVIGHELGHIIMNHNAYTANKLKNHAMEYEADRVGLGICVRYAILKGALFDDNYYTKFMLYGPLFAVAVMALLGDNESDTHPSASSRRAKLIEAYEPELRSLLEESFESVVNEIDEKLFIILNRNSLTLFDIFAKYRSIMDSIEIGSRTIDNSWLRSELLYGAA